MLVAYPGAALLVGHFLAYYAGAEGRDPALRPWVVAALVAVAATAVALGAALAALGTVPAVEEWVMGLLHNRTDRAVLSALAETAGRRLWVVVGLGGCVAVGAVAAVGLVVRRRAAAAWGVAVAASLLAFVLFVETVVPVLGRVRGLEDFAEAVRQAAARQGPEVRVFLAVEECHELAFLLDGLADELWQHPEGPAFVRSETARGRPWLVVLDRRDARAGPWREALRGWTVVAETPPGHRRPMVSLAPPGPMEGT